MSAEIINLETVTSLDLQPDRVLRAALEAGLTSVIIIGYDENGEYFASSIADGPEVLWALERSKMKLLQIVDEGQS